LSGDNLWKTPRGPGQSFLKEDPSDLHCREEDERVELLMTAIERATVGQARGPNGRAVWGIQLRRLRAVARSLDDGGAAWLAEQLAEATDSYAVRLVTTAEELAGRARAAGAAARRGDGPTLASFAP